MRIAEICQLLTNLYADYSFLLDSGLLYESDIAYFKRVSESMDDSDASLALYQLSDYLHRYYGKKVIICWMSMTRRYRNQAGQQRIYFF